MLFRDGRSDDIAHYGNGSLQFQLGVFSFGSGSG